MKGSNIVFPVFSTFPPNCNRSRLFIIMAICQFLVFQVVGVIQSHPS
jgi:hypothetical protein